MSSTGQRRASKGTGGKPRKAGYHHGDLREALIAAATRLVGEKGAENFTLADACRLAGVSTAAPYKHFRDRDEILEEITARGFDAFAERSMAAVEGHGVGTLEGITAMAQAYVKFAVEHQPVFRLMFGQNPALKSAEMVQAYGNRCLGRVIEQIGIYCERQGVEGDAKFLGVQVWTFVHGTASLLIDEDYASVAPDIYLEAMVAQAVPKLLSAPAAG
ncbi:MAG: TetR family transcriptional regulator [Proteobacteria bacterium]|nr:TetR family transcriptional regulator [Pseudomonadota bacterium]